MKAKSTYLVDALLLLGLCLIFFWRDLTPLSVDRWVFVPGDFAYQYYALAHYKALRVQNGQFALWNPFSYAGHPFLADPQSAVLYPPSLLTILFTLGQGFSYRALELEAIGHFVLVAWFMYLLGRRLTGSRIGGLTAAVGFTFSGYLASYPLLQLAILETQAWFPLILLCLELAAERLEAGAGYGAVRWAVGAGLALGISLLAGNPQSGLLVGYGSLAYGLFRLWPLPFTLSLRAQRWRLGSLVVFGMTGLGIAAVQLAPSWEFAMLSTRASLSFEESGRGFLPYDLLQLVLPAVGGGFPALYLGVLPLGLVPLALTSVRRDPSEPRASRRMIGFWGWGILFALLISFGKHLSLYSLLYLFVPGWRLFRNQERTIVWAVMAAALLSGYAIAWLSRCWMKARSESGQQDAALCLGSSSHPDRSVHQLQLGYGIGTLVAIGLAMAFFVQYQVGHEKAWGFVTALLTLALFLFLCLLALRSRRPALLLALFVLDLFTITPKLHASPADRAEVFPLRSLVATPMADPDVFRTANEDVLPGSHGLLYGLEDIRGSSPLAMKAYTQWLERMPPERAWRLLNVKYVFSWRQELEAPAERLAEDVGTDQKPVYLYRLLQPGPRAWLAAQAIAEPDTDQALQFLATSEFDPTRQVLLSAVPDGFGMAVNCNGEVIWRQREPERLALTVRTEQPCILVLSELDYPGWQATVDGIPTPILRADLIFRALAISPGRHEVVLVFRPISVWVGAMISIVTAVTAVTWLLWGQRHKMAHD